jgi:hypothetical protein
MASKNTEFTERFKRAIKITGLEYPEFAIKSKIHYPTLMNYLVPKGIGRVPEWDQLVKLAKSLETTTDWLLTGQGSMRAKAPEIKEQRDQYGTPLQPCPFCGGMSEEIKKLCKTMKEIVDSKHPVIVPALLSNLEAFKYSVDKERKQDDDIDKLKREVRHLKTLMSADMNTGSGRAAGAGMRKRKM